MIKRMLIIDDHERAAESAALLFAAWNYEVRTARTDSEALTAAAEQEPDVFLVDLVLPGMGGYEVARRLRGNPRFKNSLLIAVSGYGRESDRRRSREAGFDGHLIKPVDLKKLQNILRRRFEEL